MDPEAYRRAAHRVADWTADYLRDVERFPVLSPAQPGARASTHCPRRRRRSGEPIDAVLADVEELLIPATTHWQSPGFMAYFASSGSGPGILGETLAAAFNVNAMLWRTAPAATELEQVTLDWLRQMVGLPQPLFGVINDTASSSTLYALAAAREAQTDLRIRELGMAGRPDLPRLRYYASTEAHSSVEKAGIVLGIGRDGLRRIPVDERFRMDPVALRQAIHEDIAAGHPPVRGCRHRRHDLDDQRRPDPCDRGALRAARVVAPCRRGIRRSGRDRAGAALGARRRRARRLHRRQPAQVALHADRLQRPVDAATRRASRRVLDRAGVPHHRPTARTRTPRTSWTTEPRSAAGCARSSCGWSSAISGPTGSRNAFASTASTRRCSRAGSRASRDFELLAPAPLSVVCLRAHPPGLDDPGTLDTLNQRIVERINTGGRFFVSHTKLRGEYAIRVAFGNLRQEQRHARGVIAALRGAIDDVG